MKFSAFELDIVSSLEPGCSAVALFEVLGEDVGLHASSVHRFEFLEVEDVEFDFFFSTVLDCEVEPLCVSPGVGV